MNKSRPHPPLNPFVGHNCDRFPIVPGNDAANMLARGGGESNPLTQPKFHHLPVTSNLLHEPQPLNDDMVELNEFFLRQHVQHGQNSRQIRFTHCSNIPSR